VDLASAALTIKEQNAIRRPWTTVAGGSVHQVGFKSNAFSRAMPSYRQADLTEL
jgi:hypothetical protein